MGGGDTIDDSLGPLVQRMVATHADLPATDEVLERLRTMLPEEPQDLSDAIAADLYLAAHCLTGSSRAIVKLEQLYGRRIDDAVARVKGPRVSREDVGAVVRQRLLVGTADVPAAMAKYSGTGPLEAWLRVTTARLAINAARGRAARGSDGFAPADAESLEGVADGELEYLKGLYRDAFRDCLAEAAATLTARERTLLRYTYVEELSARRLAKLYDLHHATVARHVERARTNLIGATRDAISRRLKVSRHELESLARLAASRLDITLRRILGDPA